MFFVQVKVFDLSKADLALNDVLILGSDGLWDVVTNEEAAETVSQTLNNLPPTDSTR